MPCFNIAIAVRVVIGCLLMIACFCPASTFADTHTQCSSDSTSVQTNHWGSARGSRAHPRLALLEIEAARRKTTALESDPAWTLTRASALLDVGDHSKALALLDQLENSIDGQDRSFAALYFNEYGRGLAAAGKPAEAWRRFDQASSLAQANNNVELMRRSLLNGLRARIDGSELSGFEAHLQRVLDAMKDAKGETIALLQLAELVLRSITELALPDSLLETAHELSLRSLAARGSAGTELLVAAQAAGLQGAIAEARGDLGLAEKRTRRAVVQAEAAGSVSQVFRWQWQLARLTRAQGKNDDALTALREAVFLLEEFRSEVVPAGSDSYRTLVGPAYRSYADLLLLDSLNRSDNNQQLELRRVRDLLESLKKAEVEDYFASECLTSGTASKSVAVNGRAVLYPLLFTDRLELLLEIDGGLSRTSVPVDRVSVVSEVRRLRLNLERPESRSDYLPQAQQMYRWLIAPVQEQLAAAKIDTLILVPDGALRTIPFAALHSGEEYLIEQYALATTPAIGLMAGIDESNSLSKAPSQGNILAGGLTQSVQGFSALPGVDIEMSALVGQHDAREIRDEAFRLKTVSTGLVSPNYSVVHLATHGEFSADHRNSFLLTFDDRLRLPTLKTLLDGRASDQLDLLVLSACQSAAGDDEAALGLAGIAVQSGARSAVASLWSISDTSTAELFDVFYAELRLRGVNKAESLRRAQISLLRNERFAHPSYWAPYLLIGRVI